jgi:hypothetical protein
MTIVMFFVGTPLCPSKGLDVPKQHGARCNNLVSDRKNEHEDKKSNACMERAFIQRADTHLVDGKPAGTINAIGHVGVDDAAMLPRAWPSHHQNLTPSDRVTVEPRVWATWTR